uniref:Cytosolic 5'-nucleotidase 1A n=1 Tax=Neogobius melanostomus TaxID=47308 RepID=A0A8C6TAB7_9GOBI
MEAEMVETVEKPDVIPQVVAENALIVAVSVGAVFAAEEGEVYGAGVAFPLLQAVQTVNERLLQVDPSESERFEVILISTNRVQQQQKERLQSSASAHGLHKHRFSFACEDDFTDSLRQSKVHLFLTTDSTEATRAANEGVLSALLNPLSASGPSEQLRVLFCADAILDPSPGQKTGTHEAVQAFGSRLGKMRQRFGVGDSPLSLVLLTSHGGVNRCCSALKMLRSDGVDVDEAYCLGGTPRGLIMPLLRPHFLLAAAEE